MVRTLAPAPEGLFDLPYKVDIYTLEEGGQDREGNELPASKKYLLEAEPADLQPISGAQRAATSGTQYESTHRLYFFGKPKEGREIPQGCYVDVWLDKVQLEGFQVMFSSDWLSHFELELKKL